MERKTGIAIAASASLVLTGVALAIGLNVGSGAMNQAKAGATEIAPRVVTVEVTETPKAQDSLDREAPVQIVDVPLPAASGPAAAVSNGSPGDDRFENEDGSEPEHTEQEHADEPESGDD